MVDVSALPSFYLYEDGPFNFTESVECLMQSLGLNKEVDSFDDKVTPDLAEHMVDWWLLGRLRTHPARVDTPDEAQVLVIGTPFSTAFRAHNGVVWSNDAQVAGGPLGCGDTITSKVLYTLPSASAAAA